jgi:hypothetical protein
MVFRNVAGVEMGDLVVARLAHDGDLLAQYAGLRL